MNFKKQQLKGVEIHGDSQVGTRTVNILMGEHAGEYVRGDILDANATAILIKNLHNPDIEKLKELIEEARRKLANAVMNESIGIPGGVASLDGNGNIPTSLLGNVDVDIFMIVNELPTENIKNNKIYCVKDTESTDENNTYIEYAYINGAWEKVGEFQAEPDLSGYAKLSGATFTGNVTIESSLYTGNISTRGITKAPDNIGYLYLKDDQALSKATKVFATDGSIADLDTKANTSDVLLKKSASGGYYIEENSDELGKGAFAEGESTASGMFAHAEGRFTTASGDRSHAEGDRTIASGDRSHAEGEQTTASGDHSHAEGYQTTASGDYGSHAEGSNTTASGDYGSHAEGSNTTASGDRSHAEGSYTTASGYDSHAEGNRTISSGHDSHAEGNRTTASRDCSHAEGYRTIASGYSSHAQGSNNIENKNAIHSVGIGNDTTRKNAEYIYVKNREGAFGLTDDPKNGYKYLVGIGGYDGISTDNSTYKSVQEVIADLTARIEQLETKVRALESANTPA